MSDVEFTGPGGEPFPDDSSVGDAAWHGGFNMTLDGKQVRAAVNYILRIYGVICGPSRCYHTRTMRKTFVQQ